MSKDFLYNDPSIVTLGTSWAEEPREITYSPLNGYETKRRWTLDKAEDVVSLMSNLKGIGYTFVVTGGPTFKIEATIPGAVLSGDEVTLEPDDYTDLPDPIWEINYNMTEKDLLNSKEVPLIQFLSKNTIEDIRRSLKNPDDATANIAIYANNKQEYKAANIVKYFMMHGVTSTNVVYPVLRMTQIIPARYTTAIPTDVLDSCLGSGKIWATKDLISYEQEQTTPIPDGIITAMPSLPYKTISTSTGAPNGDTIVQSGVNGVFYYGWLKHYPQIQLIGASKYQLTQEYHYGLWLDWLYGNFDGQFPDINEATAFAA